ncbi:delta-12 fatty acid desaturase [Helicostylum pulchrum]|nr:delta-12 fatty acid desaturase [Helicostylum pulchrum]
MATQRKIDSTANPVKPNIDEAIANNWEVPDFTIKEIRDAIPVHCFRRDTFKSFTYVLHDAIFVSILAIAATYIDTIPNIYARLALWPVYWIAQSIVGFGVWIIGHECGHQAFSPSKTINNSVGFVLHTILLTPYYSWRYSHSKHHKSNGHMVKDQVHIPSLRSEVGLPPREQDSEADGPHDLFDESPLMTLYGLFEMLVFGWPAYLIKHTTGQVYPGGASHFIPTCGIFEPGQYWDVVTSVAGIAGMIGLLAYCGQVFGSLAVIKYYVIPYLGVNFWLVVITYLQHTDAKVPHYRENVWNFQRGAALTVDRSFGFLINHFHHHIADTHVAHHFFSTMPHYHAEEATIHIKKALGKHYQSDDTPIATALWNNWKSCRFVEDEGDVVFYKN